MVYLNTRDAGYIAITAAEGGIGYWSQIDRYSPSRWQPEDRIGGVRKPRDFIFYNLAQLNDDENGWDWDHPYAVTPDVIERGVNLYLTGVRDNFEGRPFADSDLSMMDADEADCVIQLGIFGRLVYG